MPPAAGVPASGLVTLCAGAIVVAALYFGRDLLVPLVLAVLLAFVLAPVARALQRWLRLGRVLSVVVAVALGFAVILGIGLAVSGQVAQLAANLPRYQAAVRAKLDSLRHGEMLQAVDGLLRSFDIGGPGNQTSLPPLVVGGATGSVPVSPAVGPGAATPLEVVLGAAEPLLAPLATAGLVVIFVVFVLLYREDLRDRVIRLAGARDLHRTIVALNDAAYRLSRYFLAQVALNASFGLFISAGLWLIGLPNPVLWGILAGLMRFVPFVGTLIAVVPPVLLALAVDPGWSLALWVLGLFLISEPLMGQVVEPLLYGHSTGLSPISVIVSATLWAFLWGPIGLLLAVPLTVCLVVLGRHVERLEFLEVMLGDRPPLRLEESFYQRALEGDADGLVSQARRQLREGNGATLAGYVDEVALRGLALAQADWSREVLDPKRTEVIRRQVEVLLDDLVDTQDASSNADTSVSAATVPETWRHEGAVLCVAGQGPFDELAASMAAQVLRGHGFGGRVKPNAALDAAQIEQRLDPTRVRLCCLSVLEGGSSAASVRYFLRRLRRHLPEARTVIALWHAASDSPMLAALRAEGPGETVVTSMGEVVALCQAASAAAATAAHAAQERGTAEAVADALTTTPSTDGGKDARPEAAPNGSDLKPTPMACASRKDSPTRRR
ncbi:AI-2E family transporter [Siccirubricoccus deserti]|nr:AI-2E family transporter [Siccirubricoccus deserti]